MKTTLRVLGLASLVFLSSCGLNNSIMKRTFNKGYYVDLGSHKNNTTQVVAKDEKKSENTIAKQDVVAQAEEATPAIPTVPATIENNAVQSTPTAIAKAEATNSNQQPDLVINNSETSLPTTKEAVQAIVKNNVANNALIDGGAKKTTWKQSVKAKIVKKAMINAAATADANLLLLVILALLGPLGLIAIYLKDGGITVNFWVHLILVLLGAGVLFVPGIMYFGFLPAIIFALLRVFDVINLGK